VAAGVRRPDAGDGLVDGVPLAARAPAALTRAVACAFTRPALVGVPEAGAEVGAATVADALTLARPGAAPQEVVRAAAAAGADGFVRRLPAGYRTELAAAPLSGGEVQRLGLARALAGQARVTIIDDAATNLDVATEALVGAAVTARFRGRTRLVRTRRASTAARTDLVVWMQDGRVRAVAPHRQLWASPDYRAVLGRGGDPP
jgi:ATP-binding cassette subfamily B protein